MIPPTSVNTHVMCITARVRDSTPKSTQLVLDYLMDKMDRIEGTTIISFQWLLMIEKQKCFRFRICNMYLSLAKNFFLSVLIKKWTLICMVYIYICVSVCVCVCIGSFKLLTSNQISLYIKYIKEYTYIYETTVSGQIGQLLKAREKDSGMNIQKKNASDLEYVIYIA